VKHFICIFTVFSVLMAAFAGGSLHFWSAVGKPPNLLLPDAYACAVKALGANTNQFYCASSQCIDLASSTGSNGEWSLAFFDTKGNAKTIHVLFDKTIHIEEGYTQLGPLLWRSFDRRPSLACQMRILVHLLHSGRIPINYTSRRPLVMANKFLWMTNGLLDLSVQRAL